MNTKTLEEIKNIITESVDAAFAQKEKISKIEKKNGVFRNTKLLMENYNAFKFNVEKGISDSNQLDINLYDEIEEDALYVLSIRRSKLRSLIMVSHIDACLEKLKERQAQKGTLEKYCVLQYHYLDGMTYENIADVYGISERTSRRWVNELLNSLGTYIFGIDGLKLP